MTLWTFDPRTLSLAEGADIAINTNAPQAWNSIQKLNSGSVKWYSTNGGEMHLESQSGTNDYAQVRRNNLAFNQLLFEGAFTKTPAPNVETRLCEFRTAASPSRAAFANIGTDNRIRLYDSGGLLLYTFVLDLDTLTSWRFAMGVKVGTTSSNGSIHAYLYDTHDASAAAEQWVFDNRNTNVSTTISELRLGWAVNTIWKLQTRHVRMEDASLAPLGPIGGGTATIDLGADRTVEALDTVSLTATTVSGAPTSYTWRQVSGPAVTLTGTGANRSFTAPATFDGTTVVIGCTPNGGVEDTVSITVLPTPSWVRLPGQSEWLPSRREQRLVW